MVRIDGPCAWQEQQTYLLVLDGVPVAAMGEKKSGRALARIAPERIETITVLRGPEAVRAFGRAAGARGVILITTRPDSVTR
jgi:hypothetical protein